MPSAPAEITKIRWSYDEYVLLAQALIACYPKRNYAAAVLLADLDFERGEFDRVQKRALPKARQRVMQSLDTARRSIFQVLANMRADAASAAPPAPEPAAAPQSVPDPAPLSRQASISWDAQEWKLFAFKLHSMAPDLHLLNSTDLDGLTTTLMNKAALVMAAGRQRSFAAIAVARTRLLEVYREARAVRDPLFYPKLELPQPPKPMLTARQERMFKRAPGPVLDVTPEFVVNAHRPPPPAQVQLTALEAPAPSLHQAELDRVERTSPAPSAAALTLVASSPQPAPAESPAGTPRSNIVWTREEWLLLAAELDRMFPLCHYPDSADLHGMTSPEVARAQQVLREDRRRPSLKVVTFKAMLRPHLLSAFRDLKNRLASAAAQEAAPPAAAPRVALAPPAPVVSAPAPYTPPAPAVMAPPNPYEIAFKPMMDMFAQQMATQLAAQLQPLQAQIAALQASLARHEAAPASPFGAIFQPDKARPAMAARLVPAAEVIEAAPAPSGPRMVRPSEAPRQRMPHIGVIGNRNAYHADLAQEFPGIRFTCIDNGKLMDSVKNCDRVIGMIKWSNHPQIAKAKKAAGERFVPIDGGLSELKRTISIWIASGILPGVAAPRPALMGTA